jgi:hypothetical protein
MKRLLISLVAVAALAAPSAALANGVVLKVDRGHHLVAVTRAGTTKVALVHTAAATRLHVGQRVALTARTLRNGTLAASAVRVVGRAHTVRFRGLLLAKSRARMIVSAGGAVIAVNKSSAGGTSPATGSTVEVTATVDEDDDDLDEDHVTMVSADAPGGAIEGKLTLGTGKITVVSEHMALVLNVPAAFDLSKFANGDEVLARFTQGADGTLTLTALSNDEDAQRADDDNDDDDGGHHRGGGEHGGGDDD